MLAEKEKEVRKKHYKQQFRLHLIGMNWTTGIVDPIGKANMFRNRVQMTIWKQEQILHYKNYKNSQQDQVPQTSEELLNRH